MATTITVYTLPDCVQCGAVKRKLGKLEAPYATVDLSLDADALARVKDRGFASAPVVEVVRDGVSEMFYGYQPARITAAAEEAIASA
jgi:glutaredoxin-like protein NrdH